MLSRSNHSAICRRFSGGKFNKKTSRTRSRSKTRLRSRSSFCGNQRAVSSDRWSWSDTYKSYFDFEFSSNFGAFMPNFSASLRPPRAILLHPLFDPLNQSSSQHARPWLPSPRTCLPRFTWIRSLSFAFAARAVKVFQEIPGRASFAYSKLMLACPGTQYARLTQYSPRISQITRNFIFFSSPNSITLSSTIITA